MQEKCLILLENIDHGGSDLAASIISLIENGCANLSNGQMVVMHKECSIIGTISLDERMDTAHIPLPLREYPYIVLLPNMDATDINTIIAKTTPTLNSIRERLISTFFKVSKLIQQQKTSVDRTLNSKDLFRATYRLAELKDLQDARAIFIELLDLWAMHLVESSLRKRVAAAIGEMLSMSEEEQNYFLNIRHPEIKIQNNQIYFGRVKIERKGQELRFALNLILLKMNL